MVVLESSGRVRVEDGCIREQCTWWRRVKDGCIREQWWRRVKDGCIREQWPVEASFDDFSAAEQLLREGKPPSIELDRAWGNDKLVRVSVFSP